MKTDATIISYVGSGTAARIYFGFGPEVTTAVYPYIIYFVVGNPNTMNHRDRVHYQISVRGKSQGDVKLIAYEIETLFDNKQETVNSFDCQNIYWDQSNMLMEGKDVYHMAIDIYLNYIHT